MYFAKLRGSFAVMRKPLNQNPLAVARRRELAGLTQTGLAERVGCSPSLISEIEGGTRNARLPLLQHIADVLDCSLDDLERAEAAA